MTTPSVSRTTGLVNYRVELDTPCLVVHRSILEQNIREMAEFAREHGIAMRPHQKTHKTAEIARMQRDAGAIGVTCAKLGEAEALVDAGVTDDVFLAYQIVGPRKIARLLELMDRAKVSVAVDSVEVAQALSEACVAAGKTLDVIIEMNTGLNRAGILPGEEAERLAEEVAAMPGLNLKGIMTHEGHVAKTTTQDELSVVASEVGQAMVDTARRLRDRGVPIEIVSVGSTPASFNTTQVEGISEMRPGTYVFYDNASFRFGRIGPERCALRILATVISRPSPDRAVIDAGSKTLTMDPAPAGRQGFGYIVEAPNAIIQRLSEEHGVVEFPDGNSELAVGDVVEIIPNHVCPTVNLQDQLFVVSDDGSIEAWDVIARGAVR
jgi:D-serine deaminase-like pyridoxal phosphate-dependent protein